MLGDPGGPLLPSCEAMVLDAPGGERGALLGASRTCRATRRRATRREVRSRRQGRAVPGRAGRACRSLAPEGRRATRQGKPLRESRSPPATPRRSAPLPRRGDSRTRDAGERSTRPLAGPSRRHGPRLRRGSTRCSPDAASPRPRRCRRRGGAAAIARRPSLPLAQPAALTSLGRGRSRPTSARGWVAGRRGAPAAWGHRCSGRPRTRNGRTRSATPRGRPSRGRRAGRGKRSAFRCGLAIVGEFQRRAKEHVHQRAWSAPKVAPNGRAPRRRRRYTTFAGPPTRSRR